MSIETWKAEFYPISAREATGSELEAALHCCRKWRGLQPSNLEKHGLTFKDFKDWCNHEWTEMCALCQLHAAGSSYDCDNCSLGQYQGRGCGSSLSPTPYGESLRRQSGGPLVYALNKVIKKLREEGEPHDPA